MEKQIIEQGVKQSHLKPTLSPNRSTHFLVPKMKVQYRYIICTIGRNWHALENGWLPYKNQEGSKAFNGLLNLLLIDWSSGYNETVLRENTWNYIDCLTMQLMYQPTRLVQGATNVVSASG